MFVATVKGWAGSSRSSAGGLFSPAQSRAICGISRSPWHGRAFTDDPKTRRALRENPLDWCSVVSRALRHAPLLVGWERINCKIRTNVCERLFYKLRSYVKYYTLLWKETRCNAINQRRVRSHDWAQEVKLAMTGKSGVPTKTHILLTYLLTYVLTHLLSFCNN